ncbi:hypothetical protein NXW30_17380 [Phocaeicola vulgatus]|nr:hypothetical protein [Phocaeicola vulgatus]
MKRGKVESVQKLWLNKDEAMAYLGCSVDYLDKLRNNARGFICQRWKNDLVQFGVDQQIFE